MGSQQWRSKDSSWRRANFSPEGGFHWNFSEFPCGITLRDSPAGTHVGLAVNRTPAPELHLIVWTQTPGRGSMALSEGVSIYLLLGLDARGQPGGSGSANNAANGG